MGVYFVLFTLVAAATASCDPKLVINYVDGNTDVLYSGSRILPTTNVTSVTPTGIWALYDGLSYDSTASITVVSKSCDGKSDSSVKSDTESLSYFYRSAKPIGSITDADLPSVTLFAEQRLVGAQTVLTKGQNQTKSSIGSLVIWKKLNVEFYTEEDFKGKSFCLVPKENELAIFKKDDYTDAPWPIFDSKSVKIGCTSGAANIFSTVLYILLPTVLVYREIFNKL